MIASVTTFDTWIHRNHPCLHKSFSTLRKNATNDLNLWKRECYPLLNANCFSDPVSNQSVSNVVYNSSILFSDHSWQILDDVCQKYAWGTPVYQLHSTKYREGSGEVQLFLYKVIVDRAASKERSDFSSHYSSYAVGFLFVDGDKKIQFPNQNIFLVILSNFWKISPQINNFAANYFKMAAKICWISKIPSAKWFRTFWVTSRYGEIWLDTFWDSNPPPLYLQFIWQKVSLFVLLWSKRSYVNFFEKNN